MQPISTCPHCGADVWTGKSVLCRDCRHAETSRPRMPAASAARPDPTYRPGLIAFSVLGYWVKRALKPC